MAYVNKLEDEQSQQGIGTAGSVLAGNSGSKGSGGQAAGSGWTNLQTYLGANEGNGGQVAQTITDEGQKAFDTGVGVANGQADAWGDAGVEAADSSAARGEIEGASTVVNTAGSDYSGTAANAMNVGYGGPKSATDVKGYNGLDQTYKNVEDSVDNFGKFTTQQAALKNKYNYSTGMSALDTAIGRGDAGNLITDWQSKSKGSLKDGDQYAGIKKNSDRITGAINGSISGISSAKDTLQQNVANRKTRDLDAAIADSAARDAAAAARPDTALGKFPGINPVLPGNYTDNVNDVQKNGTVTGDNGASIAIPAPGSASVAQVDPNREIVDTGKRSEPYNGPEATQAGVANVDLNMPMSTPETMSKEKFDEARRIVDSWQSTTPGKRRNQRR